jgi:hypothetical protein
MIYQLMFILAKAKFKINQVSVSIVKTKILLLYLFVNTFSQPRRVSQFGEKKILAVEISK